MPQLGPHWMPRQRQCENAPERLNDTQLPSTPRVKSHRRNKCTRMAPIRLWNAHVGGVVPLERCERILTFLVNK